MELFCNRVPSLPQITLYYEVRFLFLVLVPVNHVLIEHMQLCRGLAEQKVDFVTPIMDVSLDRPAKTFWQRIRRTYLPFCDPDLPEVSSLFLAFSRYVVCLRGGGGMCAGKNSSEEIV